MPAPGDHMIAKTSFLPQPGTRLFGSLKAALFSAVAALMLLSGWANSAMAQPVAKSKHGDWELRCETPTGASREQCALIQSVAAEDKPNMNLVVIVLKTADGKSRLLRVIAPL